MTTTVAADTTRRSRVPLAPRQSASPAAATWPITGQEPALNQRAMGRGRQAEESPAEEES